MFSSSSQVKKMRGLHVYQSVVPTLLSIDIIFNFLQCVLKRCVPSARQNSARCLQYACIEALEPTIVIQRT
jgi:hypothetical protein